MEVIVKILQTSAGLALSLLFFFCSTNAIETVTVRNLSKFSAYIGINDQVPLKIHPQFSAKISYSKELLELSNESSEEKGYMMQFILVNERNEPVYASRRYNIKDLFGARITLVSSPFAITFAKSCQDKKNESQEIEPIIFTDLPFFLEGLEEEKRCLRLG
jgi:hypothetical protein